MIAMMSHEELIMHPLLNTYVSFAIISVSSPLQYPKDIQEGQSRMPRSNTLDEIGARSIEWLEGYQVFISIIACQTSQESD